MTTAFPMCQSGIVFPLLSRVNPDLATALLAEVFVRRGYQATIRRDGDEILFQAAEVTLHLHLVEDRARLRLTRPPEAAGLTEAKAQALLAALTATLVRGFAAETVLWLRKDVVLPAARFVMAVDPVRPRRVQAVPETRSTRPVRGGSAQSAAWADGFEADQQIALAQLMRETADEEMAAERLTRPNVPVRLTTAMVTLFVALFSLPIGAALLVWNTFRGGDLRTSTTMLTAVALLALMGQTFAPELDYAMVMSPALIGL